MLTWIRFIRISINKVLACTEKCFLAAKAYFHYYIRVNLPSSHKCSGIYHSIKKTNMLMLYTFRRKQISTLYTPYMFTLSYKYTVNACVLIEGWKYNFASETSAGVSTSPTSSMSTCPKSPGILLVTLYVLCGVRCTNGLPYIWGPEEITWEQCRSRCQGLGGDMANLHTMEEYNGAIRFLKSQR